MSMELERIITRNQPLCDGSPRREAGFRAVLKYDKIGPKPEFGRGARINTIYIKSELLPTYEDALAWDAEGRS